MDVSPTGLAYNVLPHLPTITKTALLSLIGQSENAEHQDALTETIVAAARPVLRTPAALYQSQRALLKDPGIFGRIWIAKYVIPPPEPEFNSGTVLGVRQAVALAIKLLDPSEPYCEMPELVPVESEWTGYRKNVSHIAQRPHISEADMYNQMMAELSSDCPTVLYHHGGAHCLMDPTTHRWTTSSLARDCRGRVLSIRYRLSPQSIFPAALLDAFTAYLSLLCPPEGAYHDAVPATQIVLAGDSSGAGLATSLLLLLLTLSREGIKIRFHGHDVTIPALPCAGLAMNSPWLDVSRSLPSCSENARWDIVAPPPLDAASPPFPPDSIWPTSPPRAETYCTAHMVSHPLVSPLSASSELWRGAPPVYVCVGWEVIGDEIEVFSRRVYNSSADAVVVFDGYMGMPHCFSMVPWNQRGRDASTNLGRFCLQATRPSAVTRTDVGTWTDKNGKVKEIKLSELGLTNVGCGYNRKQPLDDVAVNALMTRSRTWRMELEEEMLREWRNKSMAKTRSTW